MKKTSGILLGMMMTISLLLAGMGDADAARLGGGRSFGSKPSFSTPFSRSGGPNQASPAQPAYQQQPSMARQQNQTARDAMGRRGGLMGMLGGLALGGLLGSLLFGGAFEGINFMDILLFGGIAFVLFKLFTMRSQNTLGRPAPLAQSYGQAPGTDAGQAHQRRAEPAQRAGFNTDLLFKRGGNGQAQVAQTRPTLPADFDAAAFLTGAKAAYAHLQKAWDQADLAALRGLCTDKVFGELREQLSQRTGENRTELLTVEVELLEVRDVGGDREATVLFEVVLKESPNQAPTQVNEVWHFTRSRASKQPTWFLDGIQQVEA